MYLFNNTRKVIVTPDDVAEFNDSWPGSNLRDRAYWFEFDENGDLIDTDVPEQDDGEAAAALSQDAQAFMEDNFPIADARLLLASTPFDLSDEQSQAVAADWLMEHGVFEEVARIAVVPEVEEEEPQRWEVHVGNIGQVYDGDDEEAARHSYETYVEQSQGGYGRAAGEGVLLQLNGEVVEETEPAPEEPDGPQEGDLVTEDRTTFREVGRNGVAFTVEGGEAEDVEVAIQAWMTENSYYPNVWFISDHGNAHLMEI